MRLRFLISLSLALLAVPAARAQTAEDFFNGGAQFYISNNIPAALERTENGLKLYPDNVKLKKLEELLKQQQRQQSQQNQQKKNNQSQQNKNQNQKSQQQQSKKSRQNQNKPQQQKNRQPQNQSGQQKQEQQQAKEKQSEQKAPAPNQMTPQDAKRLLDSQKENERFLQLKPNVPPPSKKPIEDW